MPHTPFPPMDTAHLYPLMRAELLTVLRTLTDAEWQAPTACAGWSVKDVALHLLGDDMGYLSRRRDNDGITGQFDDFAELVAFINAQNDQWVQATRRLSRRLLLDLLEFTGAAMSDYLHGLDPQAETTPVSWASDAPAPMWLQIAREITEFWMHHQHICEAVGRDSLKTAEFLQPVLRTFAHALPRTYSTVAAPTDTTIKIQLTGRITDTWFVVRVADEWRLYEAVANAPTTTITLDDDTAWRLFTKGISRADATARVHISGDEALGAVILATVAILA